MKRAPAYRESQPRAPCRAPAGARPMIAPERVTPRRMPAGRERGVRGVPPGGSAQADSGRPPPGAAPTRRQDPLVGGPRRDNWSCTRRRQDSAPAGVVAMPASSHPFLDSCLSSTFRHSKRRAAYGQRHGGGGAVEHRRREPRAGRPVPPSDMVQEFKVMRWEGRGGSSPLLPAPGCLQLLRIPRRPPRLARSSPTAQRRYDAASCCDPFSHPRS